MTSAAPTKPIPPVTLQAGLDAALPSVLTIGKGTVLPIEGWCFHPEQPLRRLELLINGHAQPVQTHGIFRPDRAEQFSGTAIERKQAGFSGFWTLAEVTAQMETGVATIGLRAELRDGRVAEAELGQIEFRAALPFQPYALPLRTRTEPLVAICMATFNPDIARFRRQIETLRTQTYPHWFCVISDDASEPARLAEMRQVLAGDERFVLIANAERLGFYHNFERALAFAPQEAAFIALADQDDDWRPHKLVACVAQFTPETLLVYSDLRIVSDTGDVWASTFWERRRNNFTDLGALIMLNTVPGAATVIRRELLETVLPFPPRLNQLIHDHWIAVMALTLGKLAFVDEPLYDWIQHQANVLGFGEQARPSHWQLLREATRRLFTVAGRVEAREVYRDHVLPRAVLARVAALRTGNAASPVKSQTLRQIAALADAPSALAWLVKHGWSRLELTNGLEYFLLPGAGWRHSLVLKSRLRQGLTF